VKAYRVTRSTGQVATFPATTRSTTLTHLSSTRALTVSVAAVNEADQVGAPATLRIDPTLTAVFAASKVRKNVALPVTTRVTLRGSRTTVSGMPVVLQRRLAGSKVWSTVSSRTTGSAGTATWTVRQSRSTAYRVVSRGVTTRFGSTSTSRGVAIR
jgi:hypothetical protein